MANSFLVAVAVSVALSGPTPPPPAEQGGAAQTPPSDAELKNLAKDLDNTSLLKMASGIRAVSQFQKWGTAARAATPYVLPLLEHKNPEVRVNAATVLGTIAPDEALPRLKALALRDPDARVRGAAARAIQDEGALLDLVRRAPRDAREVAASKLSKSEALRQLVVGGADEPEIRGDALFALADVGVIQELARSEPVPAVRRWAEIAASADPRRDLGAKDATCQRAPWAGMSNTITCTLRVINSGAAAYESTWWQLAEAGSGLSPSLERIEPGETKKLVLAGHAMTAKEGTVEITLVSAVRRRPAVTR